MINFAYMIGLFSDSLTHHIINHLGQKKKKKKIKDDKVFIIMLCERKN